VFPPFGREGRGGSKVVNLDPHVYGDIAYTTVVFTASPVWGGETLTCTNVLQRIDGVWKIIHHHSDKSPAMAAALEKIISEGG
jgi:ketosteroid isomerase-like protein